MSQDKQLITRRQTLGLIGASGAGLAVAGVGIGPAFGRTTEGHDFIADASGACKLTAEQEEGPFYVAVDAVRSDIRLGQVGLPFTIEITIINELTCKPLANAAVDIWHCNASGIYSDIASEKTTSKTYLRGVQFTDKHGKAIFHSIFPGHYSGRTTHIHARIHINSKDADHKLTGGHICHTGQCFPTEAAYTEVYKLAPYNKETATVVSHKQDRVWSDQHGYTEQMKITMAGHRLSKGLIGQVVMAVNPKATPALIGATSTGSSGTAPTGTPPTGTPPGGAPTTATTTSTTTSATTTTG